MNLHTRLSSTLAVTALPAFVDNYFWLLHDTTGDSVVIDPGDASRVEIALADMQLNLRAIFITHHHSDHIGGAYTLREHYQIPVYAPKDPRISMTTDYISEGDVLKLKQPAVEFSVWHIPGHTLSHHAFIGEGIAFVGDTLFSAGCGRIFEGTPEKMLNSLARLANLDPVTRVFCAHEYTLDNARFALEWEPDNARLQQCYAEAYGRAKDQSTIPTSIGREQEINPFLRCTEPGLISRLSSYIGKPLASRLEVFTVLRALKNDYIPNHATR